MFNLVKNALSSSGNVVISYAIFYLRNDRNSILIAISFIMGNTFINVKKIPKFSL